ncbi:3'-5' exonuclease [Deinococcus roseus]|uniref:Exonuclease n=1 Tax=Deinococcus roseus TaxID=392414 RepID=A0ABQ2CYD8_9DEIO|nr:3'-5' exonuclease [Deinococcus roseus]GGJ31562.1 exonuclease [Deinococcus roseus]
MKNILIIDVESTCWQGKIPAGMSSEVIELGYAILQEGEGVLEWGSFLIPPRHSEISAFCTELTTISPETFVLEAEKVVQRSDLLEQLNALTRRHGWHNFKSCQWGSWGDYDFKMLVKTFGEQELRKDHHLNIKQQHAAERGLPKALGMGQALRFENLELQGTHHRGGDDAFNIARIARKVLGW